LTAQGIVMNIVLLFLVFNRPEQTAAVFEAIRQARPSRLYVAADGPRDNSPDDFERCATVRRIATAIDWPCDLHTLLRPANLGCRTAVTAALDWFFALESEGIILEDDCLPDPTFFRYTSELLERYRHDERVMCITGGKPVHVSIDGSTSYFMSIYNMCGWGWASWARAWALNDPCLTRLNEFLTVHAFPGHAQSAAVARRWEERFRQVRDHGLDSWATAWNFACWANAGLTCTPRSNLVRNIGFGPDATHMWDMSSAFANLQRDPLEFPLRHPAMIAPNSRYDEQISSLFYEIRADDIESVEAALAKNLAMREADARGRHSESPGTRCMSIGHDPFRAYLEGGFDTIEGWPGTKESVLFLEVLKDWFRPCGERGGALEIGVHHAKYLIALHNLLSPCLSLGIDLFQDQSRNIDFSGLGGVDGPPSIETCRRNVSAFAANPEGIRLMPADSLTFRSQEIGDILQTHPRFAITSIDGGHTALHLSVDFMTASQLTSSFGVIAIDDLFHPDWPGVTEGIFHVLARKESSFVPLFITRKKAFFCHMSLQKRFVTFVAQQFSARYARDVRYVDFFGWRVPSFNFGSEY
jgi:hypothetical protein